MKPTRMWVNQPSTLQPLHKLHGQNVLAIPDYSEGFQCYTLSGPVISFHAPKGCLSKGWTGGLADKNHDQ